MDSYFVKFEKFQGKRRAVIEFDNDLDFEKVFKYSNGGQPMAELKVSDNRTITVEQRRKIFALIGDIKEWAGFKTNSEMAIVLKSTYIKETDADMFSLSDCSVSQAATYIEWILDFCFEHNVGFKTKTWDMLPANYSMIVRCSKKRECILCLNKADMDHTFGLVGIGRNRRKVDNSESYFLPLCRIHHTERHSLGTMTFLNKYHIKPVKLNAQTRKELHIGK